MISVEYPFTSESGASGTIPGSFPRCICPEATNVFSRAFLCPDFQNPVYSDVRLIIFGYAAFSRGVRYDDDAVTVAKLRFYALLIAVYFRVFRGVAEFFVNFEGDVERRCAGRNLDGSAVP